MLKVSQIKVKSILVKSKISDYCVNCYRGCEHACSYCYAEYMKEYTGHREQWGNYVDVKINGAELIKKEVKKKTGGEVMMSSVCDGWQPLEEKYRLSRECLAVLLENGFSVSILTKNRLILRDFDIIETHKHRVKLGLTITTLDESIRSLLEPLSSTFLERLEVVKKALEKNIPAYIFVGPLVPGFTDTRENLTQLFRTTRDLKLDNIYIDKLNYIREVYPRLKASLEPSYPDRFRSSFGPLKNRFNMLKYPKVLRERVSSIARKEGVKSPITILF